MRPLPKPIRNILIFLGICFSLYAMMVIFVVSGAVFMFMPNPPAPEIKYGEFSCRLEYELDGEIKVIEDVIICEFDGFKNYGSAGSRREWKTSLESGNEYMTP